MSYNTSFSKPKKKTGKHPQKLFRLFSGYVDVLWGIPTFWVVKTCVVPLAELLSVTINDRQIADFERLTAIQVSVCPVESPGHRHFSFPITTGLIAMAGKYH